MNNLCRICRKNCQFSPIPLLSDHDGVPLKQMLTKTCPIDITFDDPVSQLLPQSICTDCLEVVTAAYNLQQVCIESDQYFRSMVSGRLSTDLINVKTEKIDDDFDVKIENVEVTMEVGEVKVKMEAEEVEERRPKRRKTKSKSRRSDKDAKLTYKSKINNEALEFRPRRFTLSDGRRWYLCSFCDMKAKQRFKVLNHIEVHSPVLYPFSCKYCTERFVDEDGLNQHGSRAHSSLDIKTTLFCDHCGVSGDRKDGMEHHILDDHLKLARSFKKNAKTVKCPLCSNRTIERDKLDKHLLMIHNKATKCDKCDEIFRSKAEIDHHVMTVHDKLYRELEQYEVEACLKCCICEVDHGTEDELFKHYNSHRAAFFTSKKVGCYFCPKSQNTFEEFIEHARYHALPMTHECLTCKKRFPTRKKVAIHIRSHRMSEQYKYECQNCPRKFLTRKELDVHDRVKHQNEALFICPFCAMSMASSAILDQHIRFIHNKEQEKKYKCKSCPQSFLTRSKLRTHETVHSTERPHVCEICGNAFKRKHRLQTHMKVVHDPNFVKKFECSQCAFKFGDKYRLDRHMMTHSGLKPFECMFCDKAYAYKSDLTKHMQKHVGDEIYKCDQCPRGFRLKIELREHQIEHAKPRL